MGMEPAEGLAGHPFDRHDIGMADTDDINND